MAVTQEASSGAGPEARLARLLGLSQGHHALVLPVRLARGPPRRGGAQALDHRGRRHHAADPGAPAARLHLLPEHRVRRRLPIPGKRLFFRFLFFYSRRPFEATSLVGKAASSIDVGLRSIAYAVARRHTRTHIHTHTLLIDPSRATTEARARTRRARRENTQIRQTHLPRTNNNELRHTAKRTQSLTRFLGELFLQPLHLCIISISISATLARIRRVSIWRLFALCAVRFGGARIEKQQRHMSCLTKKYKEKAGRGFYPVDAAFVLPAGR